MEDFDNRVLSSMLSDSSLQSYIQNAVESRTKEELIVFLLKLAVSKQKLIDRQKEEIKSQRYRIAELEEALQVKKTPPKVQNLTMPEIAKVVEDLFVTLSGSNYYKELQESHCTNINIAKVRNALDKVLLIFPQPVYQTARLNFALFLKIIVQECVCDNLLIAHICHFPNFKLEETPIRVSLERIDQAVSKLKVSPTFININFNKDGNLVLRRNIGID